MTRLLLCCALLVVSACAHRQVAPHQRELLSRPSMDPHNEAGETKFAAHLRESREGATYGSTAGGGGCGCN